jgi:tetratricopeptide (TPR) repeat protein
MTLAPWLALWAVLSTPPTARRACALPGLAESPRIPGVPFGELERRANAAWNADRVADALRYYRAGVELDPLWLQGRWRLALLFWLAECDLEARDVVRRLVELAPDNGRGWALLGVSEYRLQEYDQALLDLSRAAALGLSEGGVGREAQRALALLLARSGEYARASRALNELVRRGSDDPEVLMACGLVALRMPCLPSEIEKADEDLVRTAGQAARATFSGALEEARARFAELIARYPRRRGVHFAYGVVLSREALPEALTMLRKEVALFPDNAEAQARLALEILDRGDPPEALAPAQAAVEHNPDSYWSQLALGRARLATGAVEEALVPLEEAARMAPDREATYVALAVAYERAGRSRDVERVREKLKELYLKRGAGGRR